MEESFSALVIHDIKNSLSLLESELEQLNQHPGVPKSGRMAYQRCVELKNRLVMFLTLYKSDRAGLKPNFREVDLPEFLEDLIASSQSVALSQKHGRTISVEFSRDSVKISPAVKHKGIAFIDEYLVDMALESALNNAMRFAKSSVSIWFEQSADRLEFFVLDDGPGATIAQDVEQRSVHGSNSSTGLGLALCRTVAEVHGAGNVSLVNAPDGGAIFSMGFSCQD